MAPSTILPAARRLQSQSCRMDESCRNRGKRIVSRVDHTVESLGCAHAIAGNAGVYPKNRSKYERTGQVVESAAGNGVSNETWNVPHAIPSAGAGFQGRSRLGPRSNS